MHNYVKIKLSFFIFVTLTIIQTLIHIRKSGHTKSSSKNCCYFYQYMPSQGFLCQCPVVPGALILPLGIKEVFCFHINKILGTLDFTIFTGSEHRVLFNFQSTGIQIVGKTQIKARATPHDLNDWNRLRAHIARNYQ